MHFILCDGIDSGKSRYVEGLVRRMLGRGATVRGFVSAAHIEGGIKAGHDLIVLDGRGLAGPIPFTRPLPFEDSFPWRRFHMSRRAFEMVEGLEVDSDLFVMDEIGPLELEDGKGFMETARRALAGAGNTLSVVRRGLEGKFIEFAGVEAKIFPLSNAESLEEALGRIGRRLRRRDRCTATANMRGRWSKSASR